MNTNTLNNDLFVYEANPQQGAKAFADNLDIKNARLGKPQTLNKYITYMMGKGGTYGAKNFPLLFALEGRGRKKAITTTDLRYNMDVFAKPSYTTQVVKNYNQTNAGVNGAYFKIGVKRQIFWTNMQINTGGVAKQVTARVLNDGVDKGGYFEYTIKLIGVPSAASCPPEALAVGAIWATGITKVGMADSKGTRQQSAPTPFKIGNSLSVVRKSYTVRGNVSKKKLTIPFKVDNKIINFWTEWEYWHNEQLAMVERNDDLIFSKLNADANGYIVDRDAESGQVIPSGMGAWDQIQNTLHFSTLSEKKIDEHIHNTLYNNDPRSAIGEDGGKEDIIIMGGVGLMKEFDKAMRNSARGFLVELPAEHFVKEVKGGLQYGNYFTQYKHYSGKIIKLVHEPAFDTGARAEAAGKHPLYPNMSKLSFCGMILDFSPIEVDGKIESNIYLTYEEGREFLEGTVQGLASMLGKDVHKYLATDLDRTSHHKLYTQGTGIFQPAKCSKFLCSID